MNPGTSGSGTSETVEPPHPAPVVDEFPPVSKREGGGREGKGREGKGGGRTNR